MEDSGQLHTSTALLLWIDPPISIQGLGCVGPGTSFKALEKEKNLLSLLGL